MSQLLTTYLSFWDNPRFRKGYQKPFCSRVEAQPYLEQAAALVEAIRKDLGLTEAELIQAGTAGSATDYFWTCTHHPRDDPKAFVRALVHSTLRDAHDHYVRDLTPAAVDALIEKHSSNVPVADLMQEDSATIGQAIETLKQEVSKLQSQLSELQNVAAQKSSDGTRQLETRQQMQLIKIQTYLESARINMSHITASLDSLPDDDQVSTSSESDKFPLFPKRKAAEPKPAQPTPATAETAPPSDQDKMQDEPAHRDPSWDQPPPEDAVNFRDGVVKVQQVASHVHDVMESVKSLDSSVDEVKVSDPNFGSDSLLALRKKCSAFNEQLMRDLLALDGVRLPPQNDEARAKRKEQVIAIQHLLDDVDRIDRKLKELQQKVEEEEKLRASKAEAERAEAERAESARAQAERAQRVASPASSVSGRSTPVAAAPAPAPAPAKTQPAEEMDVEEPATDKAMEAHSSQQAKPTSSIDMLTTRDAYTRLWPQLKLEPEFQLTHVPNGYALSSMIPGMSLDNIKVEVSGSTLLVSGVRLPTRQEVALLRNLVHRHLGRSRASQLTPSQESELMLKMAFGTFGSFRQRFQLPPDVDVDKIDASYRGGLLKLDLPRVPQPRAAPQPVQAAKRQRYDPYYDVFPGFNTFGNRDMFW